MYVHVYVCVCSFIMHDVASIDLIMHICIYTYKYIYMQVRYQHAWSSLWELRMRFLATGLSNEPNIFHFDFFEMRAVSQSHKHSHSHTHTHTHTHTHAHTRTHTATLTCYSHPFWPHLYQHNLNMKRSLYSVTRTLNLVERALHSEKSPTFYQKRPRVCENACKFWAVCCPRHV